MTAIYKLKAGTGPLLVSMPHVGTLIPPALEQRLTDAARLRPDTDWHLETLYDFLDAVDATVMVATHSRYVVDLNRPPDGANLYPGQDTTALVPLDTGDRQPIYRDAPPDAAEIAERRATYWQPYHDQLRHQLERILEQHGYALLWDAHSIKSELPRFFAGRLQDLNLGTNTGQSCGPGLGELLLAIAEDSARYTSTQRYTSILNGRYKGGYITRHYGQPSRRIHAVQLELSWATYMNESHPFAFRDDLAAQVRPMLRALIDGMVRWEAP